MVPNHLALLNGTVTRLVPVATSKRSPENTPILLHPSIDERDEEGLMTPGGGVGGKKGDKQALLYEQRNGYYGDYESPGSETRLLSREECEREADKHIKMLKRKVIEKATSADDSM